MKILKKIGGTLMLPVGMYIIMMILCYSHGKMFSKMSIFRAKNYFADQAAKYNKIGTSEAIEMAQMFDLAYEAIDAIGRDERQEKADDK